MDENREDGLELKCRIWKREPYPGVDDGEWVLEIEGEANDCSFVSRHTEPLTTPLEDVAGLPSLYTRPTPAALENREDGLVERLRNTARNLPDCGAPWAAEVVNEAADAIERLTRPAPAGDVVERVALGAHEIALASLHWNSNPALVEAANKLRDDGYNNRAGLLSNYMAGRFLDAYMGARAALAAMHPKGADDLRDTLVREILAELPLDDCGHSGDLALAIADRILAVLRAEPNPPPIVETAGHLAALKRSAE